MVLLDQEKVQWYVLSCVKWMIHQELILGMLQNGYYRWKLSLWVVSDVRSLSQIDCEKVDITKIWNKIGYFGSTPTDNTIPIAFKIIVLDGADLIPPSAQQILKKVLSDQEGKVKYIFICRDQTKLIGHILARGLAYRTRTMSERDAVGKSIFRTVLIASQALILITLHHESIGYNREGIQEIFQQIQKVFPFSDLLHISWRFN